MKKLLQLTLILSALLFTFSCDSDESTTDPSSELSQTWVVRHINAYSDAGCTQLDWNYSATAGEIDAPLAADCHNLESFFAVAGDNAVDGADFTADDFCASTDDLSISMYLQMTSTDTLATQSGGNYQKTMYAKQANGLDHAVELTTYGRYYTYGDNMATQILAKVISDDGMGNDRVVNADEDPADNVSWGFESSASTLKMTYLDNTNANDDSTPECIVISFQETSSYALRGCTDPTASNYFGGEDNNDFGITATHETGNCTYTSDEAAQTCVKIDHQDQNGDGMYKDNEWVTLGGVIDCNGDCQYEGELAWVGDGVCDGGIRSDAYNCEAFNWDEWDCACAASCKGTYDDAGATTTLPGELGSEVGEGNGWTAANCSDGVSADEETCCGANEGAWTGTECVGGTATWNADGADYTTEGCQEACNVEDCGWDISNLADVSTWDCCPLECINGASTATECNETCDIGACDFFRNAATNVAADIGLCCDQTGADGTAGTADDIDCASLAGNGSCDEECNSGACNNDGGDCE